jgi:hypothetical protein
MGSSHQSNDAAQLVWVFGFVGVLQRPVDSTGGNTKL